MRIPLWLKVKNATAEVIAAVGGNKVCAAVVTRIDRVATFSDYANETEIKRVIPLDTAIELDAFALKSGHTPVLIGLAAAELGHLLVPRISGEAGACDVGVLCSVTKETAEVVAGLAHALADGVVSIDQARALRREVEEARTALASLDLRLALIEDGEGARG